MTETKVKLLRSGLPWAPLQPALVLGPARLQCSPPPPKTIGSGRVLQRVHPVRASRPPAPSYYYLLLTPRSSSLTPPDLLSLISLGDSSAPPAPSTHHLRQAVTAASASAAHCADALEACRFLIDEVKASVPIWKKEVYEDGEMWKENAEFILARMSTTTATATAAAQDKRSCCCGSSSYPYYTSLNKKYDTLFLFVKYYKLLGEASKIFSLDEIHHMSILHLFH